MTRPLNKPLIALSVVTILLLGCSAPDDIAITDSYKAPKIEQYQDHGVLLSMCSREMLKDEILQQHALQFCPANTATVQKISHDTTWNSCPLLQKKRTTFLCVAGDGEFSVEMITKPKKSELEVPLK